MGSHDNVVRESLFLLLMAAGVVDERLLARVCVLSSAFQADAQPAVGVKSFLKIPGLAHVLAGTK